MEKGKQSKLSFLDVFDIMDIHSYGDRRSCRVFISGNGCSFVG